MLQFLVLFVCFTLVQSFESKFEKEFVEATEASGSDKVSKIHHFQAMYSIFLMQAAHQHMRKMQHDPSLRKFRIFEIGMGAENPGRSLHLWKSLFKSSAEIYMGEYDQGIVNNFNNLNPGHDFHIMVGDQADGPTLERWVRESNGGFDVIIDDGGHHNRHILTSFNVLFHQALLPGGLYYLEDLHVGTVAPYNENDDSISSILQAWIDELVIPGPSAKKHANDGDFGPPSPHVAELRKKYPKPAEVEWIFCQAEACVVGKRAATQA